MRVAQIASAVVLFIAALVFYRKAVAVDELGFDALPPFQSQQNAADDPTFARWTWDDDQITPTWHLWPDFSIRLRGRIDTDAIWTEQSPGDIATFGDLGDVVGLRRARVGIEGEMPDGRYVAELDLASGQAVPKDVFLGFDNNDKSDEARAGHFREPFSLEGGTSANSFAFMERSPANVFDPSRNWGLGWFRVGSRSR